MKKLFLILLLVIALPASASIFTVSQGGTGASTLTGCLTGNGTGAITGTGSACGSGAGGSFPFTPTSWGVSTSTTLGLLNGFLSNASSTINANLLVNGNLGLSMTPVFKLDVAGSIRSIAEAAAIDTTNSGLVAQRSTNDSVLAIGYRTTPNVWALAATYSSTGAYKPIAFYTSDSERVRIDTGGNFGIGTTSPSAKLATGGDVLIGATVAGGTNGNLFVAGNATSTNFFATTASSSNLFGAGLTSCASASNALTWTGGTFGCNSITASGGASTDKWATSTNNVDIFPNGGATTGLVVTSSSTLVNLNSTFSTSTNATTTSLAIVGTNFLGANKIVISRTNGNLDTISLPLTIGNGGTGVSTAFTKGSVVFAGTSGIYSQNNGNFLWDDTNFRLGIATTSPWAKFSIGTHNLAITSPSFIIASSSDGVATSTQFVVMNGNVGISTTTPSKLLSIGGDMLIGASTTGGTNGNLFVGGSITSAESTIATSSTITLNWQLSNQPLVRVGSGNMTINFSNYVVGQTLRVVVCNPSSSTGGTVTWGDTSILWPSGTAPTRTTTANKCDIFSFVATQATSTVVVFGSSSLNF